jgi:pimeloyl-ACP methyl ester carboxylesterase
MIETGYLERPDGERIAWRRAAGRGPTLVWLSGFHSDMAGTKAQALEAWAIEMGRAIVLFDYFGHGASSGEFEAGTITRWREDVLAVLDSLVQGPALLIGSSMGGWLSCLAAAARPDRIAALVLIAPAADFTERLMKPTLPPEALEALAARGRWVRPSLYDGEGYAITATLLEDGARWSILPGPVNVEAPVRILQGGEDPDVPWTHALELFQALNSRDAVFTLIKDGDHRLSRPADIARLLAAVEEICGAG